jgi:protease IV
MTLAGLMLAAMRVMGTSPGVGMGGRIAVVEIDGIIGEDEAFLRTLRQFRANRSVRGYLVNINSPGGVVAPSQSIFQELRGSVRRTTCPWWPPLAAWARRAATTWRWRRTRSSRCPGSITGSIGVIMEIPDASELMDKVGVSVQSVMSAEHKDVGSPFRPLGEGDRAILQELVLDVYDQFVDVVVEERGLSREAVLRVADGRILSGRQALNERLVDRLGNIGRTRWPRPA